MTGAAPQSIDDLLQDNAADAHKRERQAILDMLYRNHRSAAVVMMLNSTVTAYLLGVLEGATEVLWWWGVGIALGVTRFSLSSVYLRCREHLHSTRWTQIAAANSLSFGLHIGYLSLCCFGQAEPAGQIAVSVLTAGTIAGATIAGATYLPCFVAFTTPAASAIAIAFATQLGPSGPGLVVFTAVYVAMMFLSTKRINQLIRKNVRLSVALYRQARRDPLVDVANRLEFHRQTDEAAATARKGGEDAAIIFIDLDHFKTLNDTYGHATGDQALLAMAEGLTGALRPGDLVARLGGDEFVVFLFPASRNKALTAANKALTAVRGICLERDDGDPLSITASIGVAYSRGGFRSTEDLLSRADAAVYLAKERGRDRVEALPLNGPDDDAPAGDASSPIVGSGAPA
ncbi:MAG: GGDEF domain-containing protein [Pseudomonadota bacterium]